MSRKTRIALSAFGLFSLLAVWEALFHVGWLNAALVPAPSQLPEVFWNEVRTGIWWKMLFSSLKHYVLGVVIGTMLGISFGIGSALSSGFRAYQEWIVRLLRPVPPIAWIPFAIIWFGVTTEAAAFMIAIGVFWLNYFATVSAVMAVDKDYLELADAYGHKNFWPKLKKIILPASAPGVMSGIRSGIGQGWMLVVAAELFGIQGVGQRMMEAAGLLATDVVVVYMFTIALVYSLTDWVFMNAENFILRWQRDEA